MSRARATIGCPLFSTNVDDDIIRYSRRSTLTATENVLAHNARLQCYSRATLYVGRITTTIDIAGVISLRFLSRGVHGNHRVAYHLRRITTAKYSGVVCHMSLFVIYFALYQRVASDVQRHITRHGPEVLQ